jgi:hypothetical protein
MRAIALALLASTTFALPHNSANGVEIKRLYLENRETAYIALNNCPGQTLPKALSSSPPSAPTMKSTTAPSFGKFDVLGDSFASGVAWLVSRRYNYTDSDTCRRYIQAYGPQMGEDGRLGPDAEVHFLACSGSQTSKAR